MFDLQDTLEFLYPDQSYDELDELFDFFDQNFIATYTSAQVSNILLEKYSKQAVQLSLIKTLEEAVKNNGEIGPVMTVMDMLEKYSEGGLIFKGFDKAAQIFCVRLYVAMGAEFFDQLGDIRQRFLCGTALLPLMISYEPEFYTLHLQRYFARFCVLRLLEETRDNLVHAMEYNVTLIGEGTTAKSISVWIDDYKKIADINALNSVEQYCNDQKRFIGMLPYTKIILEQILFIYRKLVTGEVWKEVTYHLCTHLSDTEPHVFDFEKFYLERLATAPDISTWLNSYQEAVPWLRGRSTAFIEKLFAIFKQKIATDKNPEQAAKLVELINQLPPAWKDRLEKLVIFNEQTMRFEWAG